MTKNILNIIILGVIAILSGCSNEQLYNGIQQNRASACPKYPPSQYEACLRRHSRSYEDYKKSLPKKKTDRNYIS